MATIYLSASTQETNVGAGSYGTEEIRMQFLADMTKDYMTAGRGSITVYRNNGAMSLSNTIADSNAKNPDVHLALHSNAGGAQGTEVYYHYKGSGKPLAEAVYNAVAPLTCAPDRGVHADNTLYTNGLAELRETTAPAALIEIMFHDNLNDVNDYLSKVNSIALALAKAIYSYFNVAYYVAPSRLDYRGIIKKMSQYSNVWLAHFDANPQLNWSGLIEKLYYEGEGKS